MENINNFQQKAAPLNGQITDYRKIRLNKYLNLSITFYYIIAFCLYAAGEFIFLINLPSKSFIYSAIGELIPNIIIVVNLIIFSYYLNKSTDLHLRANITAINIFSAIGFFLYGINHILYFSLSLKYEFTFNATTSLTIVEQVFTGLTALVLALGSLYTKNLVEYLKLTNISKIISFSLVGSVNVLAGVTFAKTTFNLANFFSYIFLRFDFWIIVCAWNLMYVLSLFQLLKQIIMVADVPFGLAAVWTKAFMFNLIFILRENNVPFILEYVQFSVIVYIWIGLGFIVTVIFIIAFRKDSFLDVKFCEKEKQASKKKLFSENSEVPPSLI